MGQSLENRDFSSIRRDCLSSCFGGLLGEIGAGTTNCAVKASIIGASLGAVTCVAILAAQPYLLPAFPHCVALASSSNALIGVGLCAANAEASFAGGAAGCMAGCGGL